MGEVVNNKVVSVGICLGRMQGVGCCVKPHARNAMEVEYAIWCVEVMMHAIKISPMSRWTT